MKHSQRIRYFLRSLRAKLKFFLIKIKLIKGYKPNINVKKINIGGGEWRKNGWENLDIIFDYKLEDELLKPFFDNSIDYIYTSHCIEHLNFDTSSILLNDVYKKLKKGGVLRIVVPDVDKLLKIYDKYKDNSNYKFYNDKTRGHYTLKDSILELFGFNLENNRFLDKSMHLSFYSLSSLQLLLISSGFKKFKTFSFGESEVDEFKITTEHSDDGFDNADTKDISLYLEATK